MPAIRNKPPRRMLQDALRHARQVAASASRYETRLRAEGRAKGIELALFHLRKALGVTED